MGDRANIVLVSGGTCVYLYTHGLGYKIAELAAEGLRAAIDAGREDDVQYAGRIITDVFLRAHADTPHTGAGVSARPGDGMNNKVVIDFDRRTVTTTGGAPLTFQEFAEY